MSKDKIDEGTHLPGIIKELGELKSGAIINESGLAQIFNRHRVSVRRAVERGELPPPIRMFGQLAWTVGKILQHIENRLDQAAKKADDLSRKTEALLP